MIPPGKTTTPQDAADMVAYLASDIDNNITGQTYLVIGDLSLWQTASQRRGILQYLDWAYH
jgi:enoyl-[acyl-carrier-protein] reductase (NADH)